MLLVTEGIVLGRRKITESDVSLTLFTRKAGKVQVMANGARNPRSRLMSSAHPFVYGEFSLSKGKETWRLTQAMIIESHYSLREDLDRLAMGSYLLELTETVTQENQTNNRLFDLLLQSLSLIKAWNTGYNILRAAFELKVFALSGLRPRLDACVFNDEPYTGGQWYISAPDGGLVCPDCAVGMALPDAEAVFVRLLRYLTDAPLEQIVGTEISRALVEKALWFNRRYMKAHVTERPFKSLALLKNTGSRGE